MKIIRVVPSERDRSATAVVPDRQLSLAIGREGQNARLAAKLTGYKIDIRGKSGTPKEVEAKGKKAQEEARKALGVTDEVSKVKEKGTEEKKEAKGVDQPAQVLPQDDQNQPAKDQTEQTQEELPAPEEPKELEQPEEPKEIEAPEPSDTSKNDASDKPGDTT